MAAWSAWNDDGPPRCWYRATRLYLPIVSYTEIEPGFKDMAQCSSAHPRPCGLLRLWPWIRSFQECSLHIRARKLFTSRQFSSAINLMSNSIYGPNGSMQFLSIRYGNLSYTILHALLLSCSFPSYKNISGLNWDVDFRSAFKDGFSSLPVDIMSLLQTLALQIFQRWYLSIHQTAR